MNRKLFLLLVAAFLLVPASLSEIAWNDFYLSIAHIRFEVWMAENEWRSPAAQLGNAQLGVAFEYAIGSLAIAGIFVGFVYLADAGWKKYRSQKG